VNERLLERIRDGDKGAFEDFASAAMPKLYRAAFRTLRDHDLAEEVVQMTLIRFLDNVHKIKPTSMWGWLYRVLSNLATDELRRSSRKLELKEEILKAQTLDPADAIGRRELAGSIRAAVNKLGTKSKAVVLMRMDGFSYSEIAREMKMSEGSARVLFLKAVRRLATIVEAT